jgi:hypothetical protein
MGYDGSSAGSGVKSLAPAAYPVLMQCHDPNGTWQRWSVTLAASASMIFATASCRSAPRQEGSSIEVTDETGRRRAQGRSTAAAGPDLEFTRMLFPAIKDAAPDAVEGSVHDVVLPWHLKLWAMHHICEMLETSPTIEEAAVDALDPITRLYFLQRMAITEDATIEDYEVRGRSR